MEQYRGHDIKQYDNFRYSHLFRVEENGKQAYPYVFSSIDRARKSVDAWIHTNKDLAKFDSTVRNNFVIQQAVIKHIEQPNFISKIVRYIIGK
jgi:hypothetical protein